MSVKTLGIDLGKSACSAVGLDASGTVVFRRRVSRAKLPALVAKLPGCTVAMEACCGAHHLGRVFEDLGHNVRLMPPEYVQPYVKAQKNDERDAEAIAEASTRPTMRFVPVKNEDQMDMQTLHRVRSRWVGARTALVNQVRAILLERGVVIARGRRKAEQAVDALLAAEQGSSEASPRIRALIEEIREEWRQLDDRIADLDREFADRARATEATRRLTTIPGIGALNATALVAAIGAADGFERARDLAAWLGLVPRQATTGGKPRLLGISKRGNTYLRTQLIHGARAALPWIKRMDTPLGAWLRRLVDRVHVNVAVVALANKLARIAWAVLRHGRTFDSRYDAVPV